MPMRASRPSSMGHRTLISKFKDLRPEDFKLDSLLLVSSLYFLTED